MNLKKFIGCLTAGVALAVVAFSGVGNAVAKQAKAAVYPNKPTIYFVPSDNWAADGAAFRMKYFNTENPGQNGQVNGALQAEKYDGRDMYKFEVTDNSAWPNQIQFLRMKSDYSEQWNYSNQFNIHDNYGSGTDTVVMDADHSWYDTWVAGTTDEGSHTISWVVREEVVHTYAVAGILGGVDRWNTNNVAMNVDSENHVATLSNLTLQKDDSFKIRADGAWALTYGWSHANGHITISNIGDFLDGEGCLVAAASDNNIDVIHDGTFNLSLNYSTGVLTITGTRANVDTVTDHTYNLHGDRNSWGDGFGTYNSANSTIEVHLDAGENFKIVADDLHYFGIAALATPGSHFEEGENDGNIEVLVSGTYTFTLPDGFFSSGTGVTFTINPDVANGAYLRGDWGTENEDDWGWSEGGQMAMTGSGPYTVSNVPLGAGGAIKMVIYNNGIVTVWAQPSESTAGTAQFPAARAGEGGNVIVEKIGVYSVTVTLVENTTYTYTLVGADDPDLTAASTFATGFVSDMNDNCPYNNAQGKYNAGKSATTVANTWTAKMEAYADLSANAKLYLSTSKGSSVPAISAFWSSYDYIYVHYAAVRAIENADFLARNPSASNVLNPITTINNNAMLIVLGVSVIMISATGLFFFARKKKTR